MAQLDHMIVPVGDRDRAVAFYTEVLDFAAEGMDGPFAVVRVNAGLTLQFAGWGTTGGMHLAFAMGKAEFEAVFERVRREGIAYGDAFDAVGNMRGPGEESGARGMGHAVYLFDPDRHLIEIRHYGD
ncbi:MAG: VOC family protein [Deltaproteobacteria bacterium]|nr:VOC family protein [Deltaproteobacteria bacterium]